MSHGCPAAIFLSEEIIPPFKTNASGGFQDGG
jgi:hypothetical protein